MTAPPAAHRPDIGRPRRDPQGAWIAEHNEAVRDWEASALDLAQVGCLAPHALGVDGSHILERDDGAGANCGVAVASHGEARPDPTPATNIWTTSATCRSVGSFGSATRRPSRRMKKTSRPAKALAAVRRLTQSASSPDARARSRVDMMTTP